MKILIKEEKYMQYNTLQPITEQNELTEPIIGGNKQESKFNVDLLPDFLKDYVGIAQKGCNASAKALVASLLPVISVQLGNNVYMVNNSHKIYPNLWVILIGPSSQSQKSTAANMAMSTLGPYIKSLENKSETDNKRLNPIIGNVTKTKLGSMLKENPCRLLFLNEFGNFMELAFSYGNKGMIQTLTELYDSNEYNYKSMNNDINPKDCALSFLSCCTDSYIQNLFKTKADQNSGFLQRILYCIISPSSENTDITFKDNTACAEEIENYEKIFNLFRNIPGPFEIKLSESANKYATDYVNFRKNEIIDKYGNVVWSYGVRIYTQAFLKISIIIFMMENIEALHKAMETGKWADFFKSVPINQEQVTQALLLCDYFFNDTLKFINIIESGKLENESKIIEKLYLFPDYTAKHSDLLRRAHLNAKDFNNAIKTLIQQDAITVREEKSLGTYKKKLIYTLNPIAWDTYNLPGKPH
ncbi:MAG: DUF3987 domain-containing protein [Bacteroidales bacterium]